MSDLSKYFEDRLPDLLRVVQASDLRELDVRDGEWHVRLTRSGRSTPMTEPGFADAPIVEASGEADVDRILSPLVGTFYRAPQPGMPPLVSEGTEVESTTVVGIIEALHLLTDIEAGRSGVVTRVLATDGEPVEYGQTLFEVEPRG